MKPEEHALLAPGWAAMFLCPSLLRKLVTSGHLSIDDAVEVIDAALAEAERFDKSFGPSELTRQVRDLLETSLRSYQGQPKPTT